MAESQSMEGFHHDFSEGGAWGSALAIVAATSAIVAGLFLADGGREPAGWVAVAFVAGVGVVVVALGVLLGVVTRRWRSSWVEALGFGAAVLVGYVLATWNSPLAVVGLLVASLVMLFGVAHYFSRSTLFLVTLVLLVLVLAATLRLGQETVAEDRLTEARSSLRHLMEQRCTAPQAGGLDFAQAGRWIALAWPDGKEAAAEDLKCSQFGARNRPRDALLRPRDWVESFVQHSSAPRVLVANVARAELALAQARQAVAVGDDETKAADAEVESAQAELADAVVLIDSDPAASTVTDLVEGGATAIVNSLPGVSDVEPEVPIEFAAVGWLVLGLIGLVAMRQLAIHASRGGLGPVTITTAPGDMKEAVRVYLARNIPEPGAVPGGRAVAAVSDLLADYPEGSPPKWPMQIVKAVTNVFNVPAGYDVTFAEVGKDGSDDQSEGAETAVGGAGAGGGATPNAAGAGLRDVSVFVSDKRTARSLASAVHRAEGDKDPWRTAGYWAAAVVLDESVEVPPWALWRTGASKAISAYFSAEDTGRDATDKQIDQALRQAPDNGLLLMQVAAKRNLNGDLVRPFHLALRASQSHHHYLVGRYRLAVQASLLSVRMEDGREADLATREEICALLDEQAEQSNAAKPLSDALRAAWINPAPGPMEDRDARLALTSYAEDRAESLAQDLAVWRLIPGMLRRKERVATVALLDRHRRSQTLRREMTDLAQSVRVTAAIRWKRQRHEPQREALQEGATEQEKKKRQEKVEAEERVADAMEEVATKKGSLIARARRRESGWQLAYNVACLHAVQAASRVRPRAVKDDIDSAFEFFWLALERPGSASLTEKWVEHDPDLELLRKDQRYQQLLVRVREEPREAPTTATA